MRITILLICAILICCSSVFGEDSINGNLTFKVNKKFLWMPDEEIIEENKKEVILKKEKFAEVTLPGKLYDLPKEIKDTTKKKADKSTPEGLVASYFSANKVGDFKWILSNFHDDDKEEITKTFSSEKALEITKNAAKTITAIHLTGFANYKDYTLLFVKQNFKQGNNITEALACKKTENGWKLTNSLSDDKTFDIVFAAIRDGKVLDSTKTKATILKPEARFIR